MGQPVAFKEANVVLAPPAPAPEDAPPLLHARRLDGRIVTCWTLSLPEIEEIVRTGRVWLATWSPGTMAPTVVSGHKADVI